LCVLSSRYGTSARRKLAVLIDVQDSVKQTTLTEQDAEQQVMVDVKAKFLKLAEARALLATSALTQEAEREKMRVVTNRYGQKAALLSDILQ
jgi:hypothetical protein